MGTALITGGGRGIGRAAAAALASAGFDIAVVSLEPESAFEPALRDLRAQGISPADIRRMVGLPAA